MCEAGHLCLTCMTVYAHKLQVFHPLPCERLRGACVNQARPGEHATHAQTEHLDCMHVPCCRGTRFALRTLPALWDIFPMRGSTFRITFGPREKSHRGTSDRSGAGHAPLVPRCC